MMTKVEIRDMPVIPEPPSCCGFRSALAKRLGAKKWPACCVKCCIRVPPPPKPLKPRGKCQRFFDKICCCFACCACCRPPVIDEEMGIPEASLVEPKKPSLCSRLCRALGCVKLVACCGAVTCARCCPCCSCCARISPCCRKCYRGSAVGDSNPNPLDDRRRSSHPGLKSKRASRSMPGAGEVMPQVASQTMFQIGTVQIEPQSYDKNKGLVKKLDPSLLDQNSVLQAGIPVLPLPIAWFCFVCNVLVPGLGTIASGAFCLCIGMPRFTVEDRPENRLSTFVLDLVVGVGQFFTVVFCLVGWGWSIWWGIIMVRLARKNKRLKARAAEELAKPPAPRRPSDMDKQKK